MTEILIAIIVAATIGFVGYLVLRNPMPVKTAPTTAAATPKPAAAATNPYAILSPATVPSKIAECSQPLTYASNGNPEPLSCAGGGLNILEWQALAALEPKVMTLGYGASASQVQSAVCTDATDSNSDANTNYSNVIEETTYQISALYYGWNFPSNPAAVLSNGSC